MKKLEEKSGGPKKSVKTQFFLKKNRKKIWGYQKNLRKFQIFETKFEKNLGYQKTSEKIPDFLKIKKKSGGTKIPETADHNV